MLDLRQPPAPELAATYHQQVVTGLGASVEVRDAGPGKGKGLFATQDFAAGDVLFRERALVSQQDVSSRKQLLNCSHCHRYLGSIELQIARLLNDVVTRSGESKADEDDEDDEPDEEQVQLQYRMQLLEAFVGQQKLAELTAGQIQLPMSDQVPLPPQVPCSYGCGEVYCSEGCRDAGWSSYHCLLCCGSSQQASGSGEGSGSSRAVSDNPSQPPDVVHNMRVDRQVLGQFHAHAAATNDVFLLAARLIAGVALAATAKLQAGQASAAAGLSSAGQGLHSSGAGGSSGGAGTGAEQLSEELSAPAAAALSAAWLPYSVGWKERWWESVAVPGDMDEQEFRAQLRELAEESLSLFIASVPGVVTAWLPLFHLDVWGALIGMFELNNLGLTVPSPVEDYFLLVDDLQEPEKSRVQEHTQPWLDALDKWYDTPFEGEADGRVAVYAVKDIKAGQEVTLSYLDESEDEPMSYKERQAALKDYGFKCQCDRCLADLKAKAARRPKGAGVKVGRR